MKLGVLVYIEKEEKVLMIHRQKEDEHQGFWLAPGGKLEKNEAPVETAIREVREDRPGYSNTRSKSGAEFSR